MSHDDKSALFSAAAEKAEVPSVRATGCRFYGKNGMFHEHFGLVDQGGNQCGLILDSYSPCRMEILGDKPDLVRCPVGANVRRLIRIWMI
jgi:hypothetical protein